MYFVSISGYTDEIKRCAHESLRTFKFNLIMLVVNKMSWILKQTYDF